MYVKSLPDPVAHRDLRRPVVECTSDEDLAPAVLPPEDGRALLLHRHYWYWSTSIGAPPRFGGVGASGGLGDVAGPGATARGRSETGRWPVGGMGAFSARGREPGGSSPPTSAHWLPMAYAVLLGAAAAYRRRAVLRLDRCFTASATA